MTWAVDPMALAPLRESLLASARREADATVAAATAHAEELVSASRAAAEARIASARAEGTADATRSASAEVTAARLQARTIVLTARSSLDDELRASVRARLHDLRDDAAYDRLRVALRHRGRALLGDAAAYREPDGGGVVVETAGRRVDASLDALAQWAVDSAIDADTEAST